MAPKKKPRLDPYGARLPLAVNYGGVKLLRDALTPELLEAEFGENADETCDGCGGYHRVTFVYSEFGVKVGNKTCLETAIALKNNSEEILEEGERIARAQKARRTRKRNQAAKKKAAAKPQRHLVAV